MATTALSPTTVLDVDDIQGLVHQGYGKLRAATFLVLQISDGVAARTWLRALLPDVMFGEQRPDGSAINIAFTAEGLRRLGLPADVINGFSLEFLEGMVSAHRSRLLADQGSAAPDQWTWGGPTGTQVDAALLVYASDKDALARVVQVIRSGLAGGGLVELIALPTQDIGLSEHFGFRDGLSQPTIANGNDGGESMHTIQAGEFLLGYLNEHDQYSRSPLVPPGDDPAGLLPERLSGGAGQSAPVPPAMSKAHDFGRNGSYLVLRTLSQDVGGFWQYVDQSTLRVDGSSDPPAREHLASQMVGRWPSGAPLTRTSDVDRPELTEDNEFGYSTKDPYGFGCPIGAHVRRANPRDSLPPDPGTNKSIDVGKRHRLLRRGRAYGPPIERDQALAEGASTSDQRGLHFIALCADIARQFEFVSHTWVFNPNFAGLLDDADPLLSGHTGEGENFTVQADPARQRYSEVPAFVTTRGGAYFFLPGRRALSYLCRG